MGHDMCLGEPLRALSTSLNTDYLYALVPHAATVNDIAYTIITHVHGELSGKQGRVCGACTVEPSTCLNTGLRYMHTYFGGLPSNRATNDGSICC